MPVASTLAKVYSAAVYEVDAFEVEIEVNASSGNPVIVVVGLQGAETMATEATEAKNAAQLAVVAVAPGNTAQVASPRKNWVGSLGIGGTNRKSG